MIHRYHDVEAERGALAEILESGILDRSPNLRKLLSFLCERYWSGHGGELKEYTIATEALGRPPEFDPKKDSIVRVEMHRLRRKLASFYETKDREAAVRISIPEGQYVPLFVARTALQIPEPVATAVREIPPPVTVTVPAVELAVPPPRPHPVSFAVWLGLGVVAVAAVASGLYVRTAPRPEPLPIEPPPIEASPRNEVLILAGRAKDYVDAQGRQWLSDRYFSGGIAKTHPRVPVNFAADPELFAGHREGTFQYDIPLEPGSYEVRLYFAEMLFGEGNAAGGAESTRLFHVAANGRPLLELFDVLADAPGPRTAAIRCFKDLRPAADGKLHLSFSDANHDDPFVNAIEVRRTAPGRIRPIRLVAQRQSVRDVHGRIWLPDNAAMNGSLVKRNRPAEGTELPEIYTGERFGNFSYSIPVAANGVYRVALHFHEAWFGEGNSGGEGPGARRFDVYVNHRPLLASFDPLKTAGAPRRAIVKTFYGIRPDARGRLVFDFEPLRNYACINAIEIVDESPAPNERIP